jgi:signal transduction histidine kinase
MDKASDVLLRNSARLIREKRISPRHYHYETFSRLASELNLSHAYVANRQGKYLVSTHEPLSQMPSMFAYNPDFSRLLHSDEIIVTAIIPSLQVPGGYKFASFSTADRQFLMEISLEGIVIGDILQNSLSAYPELKSLELYASNGEPLYCVQKNQKKECPGIKDTVLNIPQNFPDRMTLTTLVNASNVKNGEHLRLSGDLPYHYILRVSISKAHLIQTERDLLGFWEIILAIVVIISALASRWIARVLVRQINVIRLSVEEIINFNDLDRRIPILSRVDEMGMLAERINKMVERLQIDHEYVVNNEKLAVAVQVAHDIRSPLSALEVVSNLVKGLPESHRLLIRASISRIRDIANNLTQVSPRPKNVPSPPNAPAGLRQRDTYLISSIIGSLVTEKRMQYRPKIGIEIESSLGPDSYGIFCAVDLIEFKRVLSNLINNAVEALDSQTYQGHVVIGLRRAGDRAILSISDNGHGIANELLPELGKKGITQGKPDGLGLGIHHAFTKLEQWGGTLQFVSTPGQGTIVTLSLPVQQPPAWFVQKIILPSRSEIVVLDDDSSIHHIWDQRLKEILEKHSEVEVLHFSTPDQIETYVKQRAPGRPPIFLLDYELLGFGINGIEIIEKFELIRDAILVTSQYETNEIIQKCENRGLRLIPKEMVAFVPIEVLTDVDLPDLS